MGRAKSLMVQGTSSYAGKSFLVMVLCKIFRDRGYRVAPFKSQNTSLNSYVTPDGKELARAQALQAFAAGIEPEIDMNPILIKPMGESRSQLIVLGKPVKNLEAKDYYEGFVSRYGIPAVEEAYRRLSQSYDLIVMEGAGSPAEINLTERDIANMKAAEIADAPVLLIADIDRGGVFASIYGTIHLLEEEHRDRIKGIVINKFRGDIEILKPGIEMIEKKVGKPVLGVLPYIQDLRLPDEDSLSLEKYTRPGGGGPEVAVLRLPRISNFTDFDPFLYDGVPVRYVERVEDLRHPSALILPGTKNTLEDLRWIREQGFEPEIREMAGKVPIIGICGGFQILGRVIRDVEGIEGGGGEEEGLGLLDIETEFRKYEKVTRRVEGRVLPSGGPLEAAAGETVHGYEIHMGTSRLGKGVKPLLRIGERVDGAATEDGMVFGTYLHGIFDAPALRKSLLQFLRSLPKEEGGGVSEDAEDAWSASIERASRIVSENLDIDRIERIFLGGE
jgi:adenosylcobyric acid synthase